MQGLRSAVARGGCARSAINAVISVVLWLTMGDIYVGVTGWLSERWLSNWTGPGNPLAHTTVVEAVERISQGLAGASRPGS